MVSVLNSAGMSSRNAEGWSALPASGSGGAELWTERLGAGLLLEGDGAISSFFICSSAEEWRHVAAAWEM